MKTQKPCDCKSEHEIKQLDAQGISHNEWMFSVCPSIVKIEHRLYGEIRIPMSIFTKFAKWYTEPEELIPQNNKTNRLLGQLNRLSIT